MGTYDDSKGGPGAVFPDGADTSEDAWNRSAPLITAAEVRDKHLWGIQLVSGQKDVITKKNRVMTDTEIEEIIIDALDTVEEETGTLVMPTQIGEKHAFDMHEYYSFGYFRTRKRPVMSIESSTITPATDIDTFPIPNDWIETGLLHQGQINIIPMAVALNSGGLTTPTSVAGSSFIRVAGYL